MNIVKILSKAFFIAHLPWLLFHIQRIASNVEIDVKVAMSYSKILKRRSACCIQQEKYHSQ